MNKDCSKSLNLLAAIFDDIDLEKNPDLDMALECIHDISTLFKQHDYHFLSLGFALNANYFNDLLVAFISYLYTQKSVKSFLIIAEDNQELDGQFPFNHNEIKLYFENKKSFQISQNNLIEKYKDIDNLVIIVIKASQYKTYEFIAHLNKINPLLSLEIVDIRNIDDYKFKNLVQL